VRTSVQHGELRRRDAQHEDVAQPHPRGAQLAQRSAVGGHDGEQPGRRDGARRGGDIQREQYVARARRGGAQQRV
jgi:hypothetical protein